MSLRLKTFLLSYAILVVFGATIYVTAERLLLPGFVDLETLDMREDLSRVSHLLEFELTTMGATAADWAEWDDTYQFMADGNADYIDANLYEQTLVTLDFNALFLIDGAGQVVFSLAVDPTTGEAVEIPPGFDTLLQPGSRLLVHETDEVSRAGIVQLPSGPVAVAANAVLTSVAEGPARGTLIWARTLDSRRADRFGTILNLPITFYRFDATGLPESALAARESLGGESIFISPEGNDNLAGYLRLDDLYGEPALMVRLEKPRAIVIHGMQAVRTLMAVLLSAGTVVMLLMVVASRHMMLNRVSRLTTTVNYVRLSGDLAVTVPSSGRDELGQLGAGIAAMLAALREAHETVERARDELEHRVIERTAELRQAKEDAEAVLANTSDVIVQTDGNFGVVRVNPAFERLFGVNPAEVLGQKLETAALTHGRAVLLETLRRLTAEQPTGRVELQVQLKDGTYLGLDTAVSVVTEQDGTRRGYVAVIRDVTARQAAEMRQVQLIMGLRRVLNLASELITSADVDTLCRRAVEALRADLGLERCSIFLEDNDYLQGTYGVDGHGRITAEHKQRFAMNDAIWQSRNQPVAPDQPRWLVVEEPHYEWDGEQTHVIGEGWVAITPIVTSRGFIGVLVNDTAITKAALDPMLQEIVTVFGSLFGALYEHKQAEEAVKTALNRQIELNALKARFVSMVSHEFRTPLAVIQTSMDILQRYSDRLSDERRSEYLQETERQVQHMKALMEDYLTLDRVEVRQTHVELTSRDIVAFCRGLIDELRLVSPARVIQFNTPFEACHAEIDTGLMQQAITNLLSNAIKYSNDSTVIYVDLSCGDDALTLTVRDEGIGIPESEQGHLFEMFFRASNAEQRPGTGLGLAIVKRAVEAHHGAISVTSQEGVGTSITLSLPLAAAEPATSDANA